MLLTAADLVEVPDGISADDAETLVVNGLTAYQMLHRSAKVRAGQTVLITGAGGGVGSILVQLARHAGARVLGTASPRHHEALRALGAEPIDYRDPDVATRVREPAPDGVDAVFDHLAGASATTSYRLLNNTGPLVFDHTVVVWDLTGSGAKTVLTGHQAPVTSVTFSPDGTKLVSAGQDRVARLWDVAAGRELGVLRGHDGIVRAAIFSPDGLTIATGSVDKTIRLWHAPGDLRQVSTLDGHTEAAVTLAFTSDGRTLLSGSDDDSTALWRIPDRPLDQIDVDTAARWVCDHVGTPISPADWTAHFPGVPYQPPCG